jgi:uncharacterized protein (DUF433 family)
MLLIQEERIPMKADDHGTLRVGSTRVTLGAVIACFEAGATPEDIVDSYGSLSLADVYSVLGYYLRHEDEVRAQLQRERRDGDVLRQEIEGAFSPNPMRERLRRKKRELACGDSGPCG